jgi:uncharacterized protein (UPF0128 family)
VYVDYTYIAKKFINKKICNDCYSKIIISKDNAYVCNWNRDQSDQMGLWKNRPKRSPTHFLSIHNLHTLRIKVAQKCLLRLQFSKKLLKLNNCPISNLVTLTGILDVQIRTHRKVGRCTRIGRVVNRTESLRSRGSPTTVTRFGEISPSGKNDQFTLQRT